MEGCSKSHLSHVRDEVGKTTLLPLILDAHLAQNRTEIDLKSFRNRNKNLLIFSFDFQMVLSQFWTLWATLGSRRGWSRNRVFSVRHRPGTQNGSKTSPKSLWDTPEPQISMTFLRFLIEFGYDFSLFVGFGTVAGRPKALGYKSSETIIKKQISYLEFPGPS